MPALFLLKNALNESDVKSDWKMMENLSKNQTHNMPSYYFFRS